MDLINWNNFCKTYDIQYIDKLSKQGKKFLENYIKNNSFKFKGLERILNLYFYNSIHKPINNCNNIGPLLSLSYHISTEYNKYIYIFGERHYSKNKCKIQEKCNIYDFIINQITTVPKMLDVFLETPYITKENKYITTENTGILEKFHNELKSCLDIYKNCSYPNIRFHNTDIRRINDQNNFILNIFNTLINIDYGIYLNNNKSYLLMLLHDKLYNKQRKEYNNAIKTHDTLFEYILKKFERAKLEKQQEKIVNENIKYILLKYLQNNIKKIDLKYLNLKLIHEEVYKLPKTTSILLKNITMTFIYLLDPFMDAYLFSRMFRSFKKIKYQNSEDSKYIIIYVGDAHANNYRELLNQLNFKTVFYKYSKPDKYCVDISQLKLPLFSEDMENKSEIKKKEVKKKEEVKKDEKKKFKDTYTITFGDQAENNVGMQKIGKLSDVGFTCKELKELYNKYKDEYNVEFVNLTDYYPSEEKIKADKACVVIFRNSDKTNIFNADKLYEEQKKLIYDSKALMRGQVKNKLARHNLCFGDKCQEPEYISGKGRIIAYKDVPQLDKLLNTLPEMFGEKAKNLVAEGNYYYDIKKTGIGFHGDSERKKVIAIRLGASIPLHYQWFLNGLPIGKRVKLTLNHGDMYIMSEKAVGYDWKRRKIPTLRHAAGADKYLTIKEKKPKEKKKGN